MTRTRSALAAVAVLALLTACGSSGSATSSSTSPASAPTPSATPSETPATTPSESASVGTSRTPRAVPTSLQALQLCAITLGYATGALAGAPEAQMKTFEAGIASAQQKAGPAEAELAAQAGVVVETIKSGDQEAISAAGKKMGELCGSG